MNPVMMNASACWLYRLRIGSAYFHTLPHPSSNVITTLRGGSGSPSIQRSSCAAASVVHPASWSIRIWAANVSGVTEYCDLV